MSVSPELKNVMPNYTFSCLAENQALIPLVTRDVDYIYRTPQSKENKIPEVGLSCPPPAPKKPRPVAVLCKRKLSELEFFKVEAEEMDRLFLSNANKKKKINNNNKYKKELHQ
ncbi:hypothetical protein IHE45_11G084900 [Dioscorea alata]|uniref:Uncharacterized protein n=1 Tax=Dioscorea alata TaxID=55571 RepID=A0ACB7V7R6_DIOAL|nr:hypothetical protein IHE45_11G084900 [Dioscorea alata]